LHLVYVFDNYVLDPDLRELRKGAAIVAMEPQAFDLLLHLIRHRDHVVSRDELIEQIWAGRIVSESALSTRINAVRTAIGDSGTEQRLIRTLPRKGVRFVGEVREECKRSEVPDANPLVSRAAGPLPAVIALNGGHSDTPSPAMAAPAGSRRLAPGLTVAALTMAGALACAVLTWNYLARSAQSEASRANIETAVRLTRISETVQMTSREDYEAARELRQWAADLDRHNAIALADLSFALATGVLNHWSSDEVADLHAADLALQDALTIAPENRRVHGAQCQFLRAMRRFEAAIKVCSELAQNFPDYAYPHKEMGYDRLMMGQPDEALAEFLEADRLAPHSHLRWSWQQGAGLVYLMQAKDQEAIDWLSRAAREAPNVGDPTAYLASAYALLGREQEAHEALDRYRKLWPKTTLKTFSPRIGTAAFTSKMERVLQGLRLAGLPE
jgi:DNA-binding winged helix-turn-helix (wHTH) protein/tetratricopeptide (TPR) repeat protein